MRKVRFAVLVWLGLAGVAARAQPPPHTVLKLCTTVKGLDQDAVVSALDAVAEELDSQGAFVSSQQENVTEKSTCCYTPECVLAAGKSLGATGVLNISILRVGPLVSMMFRAYDTRTGKKRLQISLTSALEDFPPPVSIKHHVERILGEFREQGRVDSTPETGKPSKDKSEPKEEEDPAPDRTTP